MLKFKLNRDVSPKDCPWLDRTYKQGETVYAYTGATYGCITPFGQAVTEQPDQTPFFELPAFALDTVK